MTRPRTGGALARVAALVLAGAALLALGGYLAAPLLFNQRVDEAFPAAAPAAALPTAAPAPTAMAAGMQHPTAMATGMQHPTAMAAGMQHPTMQAAETAAAPTPAGPLLLRLGQFGAMDDNLHTGQGRAAIYDLGGGERVLRLEDFRVTNGPDLYVYLSASADPRRAAELRAAPAVNLARLKGNIGNQNYSLPADLDLAPYRTVVIYCKKYDVIISTAPLREA